MTDIAQYFSPETVLILETDTRDAAISELVGAVNAAGKIPDRDRFFEALLAREKVVSTGIGMGIAIPHAKLASFKNFFIAVGISKTGIPWDSLDGAPVKLIFLVGGPDNRQTDYLQILSKLTSAVKDETRRKELLTARDADHVVELFQSW